jgi:hypothetical protein
MKEELKKSLREKQQKSTFEKSIHFVLMIFNVYSKGVKTVGRYYLLGEHQMYPNRTVFIGSWGHFFPVRTFLCETCLRKYAQSIGRTKKQAHPGDFWRFGGLIRRLGRVLDTFWFSRDLAKIPTPNGFPKNPMFEP